MKKGLNNNINIENILENELNELVNPQENIIDKVIEINEVDQIADIINKMKELKEKELKQRNKKPKKQNRDVNKEVN